MFKINHTNRSNSVDLAHTKRKLNKSMININTNNNTHDSNSNMNSNVKINNSTGVISNTKTKSTDLTTHGLIELHKFLKDQQIYTNPNDNFKRRTVVLIRSITNKRSTTPVNTSKLRNQNSTSQTVENTNNGEFGFHLQAYGVINITTQQTEYICFVNNVQPNSPAQQAGLNNGDVILAIDSICINEFTSLESIMSHIKGKTELRLVIMCENISKKIQLKQRYNRLIKTINDKKQELERIAKQEENIFKKYNISPPSSNNTSTSSNNTTNNSSILSTTSSSIECFISPNHSKIEQTNEFIKNSTPNEQMSASTTSTASSDSTSSSSISITPNDSTRKKVPIQVAVILAKGDTRVNTSKSSPNGTARITVESSFTSPLALPTSSSSSTSSFTSEADTPNSSSDNSKPTSFTSVTRPDLPFLKQTPRMSRTALSSSMSYLTKLNSNFKPIPRHAIQLNNHSLTRTTTIDSKQTNELNLLKTKSNSLENSLNDQSDISGRNSDVNESKIVNFVALSNSYTPATNSLSSSLTSSSLSSSSSISPHLQLTSSIIDKSFSSDVDTGVGVGIGTVTDCNKNEINNFKLDSKYSSDSYVITRL